MKNVLAVNVYNVLSVAVETGIDAGWRRAHKHEESPGAGHIKEEILEAVLNECSVIFNFDESAS